MPSGVDSGERIARVRIQLGNRQVLGLGLFSAQANDLVALDDFIYAEPVAGAESDPAR